MEDKQPTIKADYIFPKIEDPEILALALGKNRLEWDDVLEKYEII